MVRLLRDTQRIRSTWLRDYVKTLRKNVGLNRFKKGGEPIEKIKRTRNGFYIHTFKSCCFYSTADSWDDERDFKQPKSVECHLQFVCYWWWCSAQSLMISPKHGTTQKLRPVLPGHPDRLSKWDGNQPCVTFQWYPFVKAVAIKGPAIPWPKPEPGCGLAALM